MKRKFELTTKNHKDGSKTIVARLMPVNIASAVGKDMLAIEMAPVTYQWVGQRGIDDYAERKHKKVTDGYSIKLANDVLFNVFIMADGSHEFENLNADVTKLAGDAVSQASWLRGAVQNANGFAHTAKRYAETYKNFYGPLTEEQMKWMEENTLSFEAAIEQSKARARANAEVKDAKQN